MADSTVFLRNSGYGGHAPLDFRLVSAKRNPDNLAVIGTSLKTEYGQ